MLLADVAQTCRILSGVSSNLLDDVEQCTSRNTVSSSHVWHTVCSADHPCAAIQIFYNVPLYHHPKLSVEFRFAGFPYVMQAACLSVTPSVSEDELRHYERMRLQFSGDGIDDPTAAEARGVWKPAARMA